MDTYLVVVVAVVITAVCGSRDITVSSSQCGTYSLDDGSITLRYNGDSLYSECRFTISKSDYTQKICSSPEKFSINSCDTTLEYHNGYYSSYSPDATYSCSQRQASSYCTTFSTLVIVFKNDGRRTSDIIKLKIQEENDEFGMDVIDTVKTTVYVIVGVIVGVIVLVIIVTVIVIVVCCRRSQSRPGQVFRGPQAGVVTTTTYPMQNQAGYQPVQPGYQPAPQSGFQPQPGYQPAAYPPAPQQGYAGYQAGPDPNAAEKASAPPMGMQPPPYPGN